MFWKFPQTPISGYLGDKLVITIIFFIIIYNSFPFSIGPLITSIFGYLIWLYDIFKIKFLFNYENLEENNNLFLHENLNEQNQNENLIQNYQYSTQLEEICSMGFGEEEAKNALLQFNGNVEESVNYLLELR